MESPAATPTPCPRSLTRGISEETLGRALVATPGVEQDGKGERKAICFKGDASKIFAGTASSEGPPWTRCEPPPTMGKVHPTLEEMGWMATACTAWEGLLMVDAQVQTDQSCTEAMCAWAGAEGQIQAEWTMPMQNNELLQRHCRAQQDNDRAAARSTSFGQTDGFVPPDYSSVIATTAVEAMQNANWWQSSEATSLDSEASLDMGPLQGESMEGASEGVGCWGKQAGTRLDMDDGATARPRWADQQNEEAMTGEDEKILDRLPQEDAGDEFLVKKAKAKALEGMQPRSEGPDGQLFGTLLDLKKRRLRR